MASLKMSIVHRWNPNILILGNRDQTTNWEKHLCSMATGINEFHRDKRSINAHESKISAF